MEEGYDQKVKVVGGTLAGVGEVDQGAPGATPWKVDDDATQALLTAAFDITLGALRDAIRGASSKTLTDVDGHVDGIEALLAAGLPAALGASGGLKVEGQPAVSGGLSIYRNLDVQTAGVRIKSGAGQLYWAWISNQAATVRFVKLYDSNNSPPTSAETPVLTLAVPAASGGVAPIPIGLAFAAGIGIRASSAVADNDATAPSANDVIVNLGYK